VNDYFKPKDLMVAIKGWVSFNSFYKLALTFIC